MRLLQAQEVFRKELDKVWTQLTDKYGYCNIVGSGGEVSKIFVGWYKPGPVVESTLTLKGVKITLRAKSAMDLIAMKDDVCSMI